MAPSRRRNIASTEAAELKDMQTVQDAAALRATIRGWRGQGLTVGFVPTLGNLHAGHHSLIKLARARADRVVASVFVNPTQFGPNEDFERYPRTLVQDQVGLAEQDCDLLFAPEVPTLYPFGAQNSVSIHVPQLTETLEGAHRPGHFDGVATVGPSGLRNPLAWQSDLRSVMFEDLEHVVEAGRDEQNNVNWAERVEFPKAPPRSRRAVD